MFFVDFRGGFVFYEINVSALLLQTQQHINLDKADQIPRRIFPSPDVMS